MTNRWRRFLWPYRLSSIAIDCYRLSQCSFIDANFKNSKNCSFIHLTIFSFLHTRLIKIYKQDFSRVPTHGLKRDNNLPKSKRSIILHWGRLLAADLEKCFSVNTSAKWWSRFLIWNARLVIPEDYQQSITVKMNIWKIIYLNCEERYEEIIDHRTYTHNLSSCEIKVRKKFTPEIHLSSQFK